MSKENQTKVFLEAAERVGIEPTEHHVKTWRDDLFSLKDDYREPTPILARGDNEILHLGDIQMIEGQAKSKKSFLVSAMAAAALGGEPDNCLGFSACKDGITKVLYIDTEQNGSLTRRIVRRILRMAGLDTDKDDERLVVLNQRGDTPEERLSFSLAAIEEVKPDICFIDGVKDLSGNFNDQGEAYNLVGRLMGATVHCDCAIVCVMHQNFGTVKARGHLGSALYEKVSLCLSLTVDNSTNEGITRVSATMARYTKEPEDFAFIIDDEYLPKLTTPPVKSSKMEDVRTILEQVMQPQEIVRAGELSERIMDKIGCKKRTASDYLQIGEQEGVLSHYGSRRDSRYQLKPVTTDEPNDARDDELPF